MSANLAVYHDFLGREVHVVTDGRYRPATVVAVAYNSGNGFQLLINVNGTLKSVPASGVDLA